MGVSVFSPLNDLMAITQAAVHGRRIRSTQIAQPPVFILGHWRSGTTLLHELLVHDERFVSPNTYQCFAPWHFLLSEPLMVKLGGFLLPKHRPMDNMEAGWLLPQEDEFALMNLGVPTPYLRIAFPQSQPKLLDYLDMENLKPQELDDWRKRFEWFLKALTYHYDGKQLVLKSPPHTGRIAELAEMFPGAKFIHLTRDPASLYSSTLRLWRSLEEVQALHDSPSEAEMEVYVTESLKRMYRRFDSARKQIAPQDIVDVRYEDLAANPLATVCSVYEQLELGGFEQVEPALVRRLENHEQYRPNQHALDDAQRRKVLELWPEYAERYGYANQAVNGL